MFHFCLERMSADDAAAKFRDGSAERLLHGVLRGSAYFVGGLAEVRDALRREQTHLQDEEREDWLESGDEQDFERLEAARA